MESNELIEKPAHSRLPLLDLGIDWIPGWEEFLTSLREAFAGPRPNGDEAVSGGPELRVEWIRGRKPDRTFAAALCSHAAIVWLATLPIWGFLPKTEHTLAPAQIELSWYAPQELRPILLPARPLKSHAMQSRPVSRPREIPRPDEQPREQPGADAYRPRQTILSVPVKLTHPRQTLIQPKAAPEAPKIIQQMPNMVEWADASPKLQLQIPVAASRPQLRQRRVQDAAAPDLMSVAEDAGPVNIAAAHEAAPTLQMPIAPMSAAVARSGAPRQQEAAAPVIDAASAGNSGDLRRIVALSAVPAPPAPEVPVPQGNLAAKISISPDGVKPGTPDTVAHAAPASAADSNANSLPAAIQVSGGNAQPKGTGIPSALNLSARPNLNAMIPAAPSGPVRTGPANIAGLAPGAEPEKILAGKEIGTLHVNTPNMTSTRGSWVMHFAQLHEDPRPMYRPKGELTGPLAIQTVDPKYPPETIKEHIYGEVVLYAIIRKDGSIDSIQVVQSLDPRLDKSAVEALARWQFRPGTRAGAPVDLEAVIHVPFEYRPSN